MQATHVAAASKNLIGPVCALPFSPTTNLTTSASPTTTFLSLNIDKFRAMMALLDWPFAVVSPSVYGGLGERAGDVAVCTAVVLWTQVVFGWLVPTLLLAVSLNFSGRVGKVLSEKGGVLCAAVAQTLWCVVRVFTLKYVV